jgi:predicted 3-demethylubiquinone-9 3-methyltransferase (glyoxalase superfamily)
MQKFHAFLMFVGEKCGKAEEAMKFYISLFPDSSIKQIVRNEKDGTVLHAVFVLQGQEFMASDSAADHKFTFTPAISISIQCTDEAEIDRLSAKFSDGGKFLMPLDNYGFSKKFAWVEDRYGVSWQINLRS